MSWWEFIVIITKLGCFKVINVGIEGFMNQRRFLDKRRDITSLGTFGSSYFSFCSLVLALSLTISLTSVELITGTLQSSTFLC